MIATIHTDTAAATGLVTNPSPACVAASAGASDMDAGQRRGASRASATAASCSARRPAWRYRQREFLGSTWGIGQRHELFTDLYSAMATAFFTADHIAPIPNAWPQFGELEEHHGYAWWVGYSWEAQGKREERACVAQFASWSEAFFYAEARQQREDKGRSDRHWLVRFTWHRTPEAARQAKAGQLVYLETLPAYWLRDKRRAEERARLKAQRRAA